MDNSLNNIYLTTTMKPTTPKGTRDFSPVEMARRNYIFDTIRTVFHRYGFRQIETPAMENLTTLMGKYGEEGDKLLFKVLNSGDWAAKLPDEELQARNSVRLTNMVCEKGLRYDLTVPFARYVVQHREEITFPFKRYQIQPVWRADRPQKGRYREFYQCDADVVGSDSLLLEAELVEMMDAAFSAFGIDVVIKINNRKVLAGIAETVGAADRIADITVAVDKLDKIGLDGVNRELEEKGIPAEAVERLRPVIMLEGTNDEKIDTLRTVLASSETGLKGVDEVEEVLRHVGESGLKNRVELDLTLARGLNYYTGAIFEVKALGVEIGSISGGGRYDNLTGIFGLPGVSGVGFSFGADRIYDVLTALDKFPAELTAASCIVFLAFDNRGLEFGCKAVRTVRRAGIDAELYPDCAKMKKQMAYANANNIPYVGIIGDDELAAGKVTLKDMMSGEQRMLSVDEIISVLAN